LDSPSLHFFLVVDVDFDVRQTICLANDDQ
jgi:hypothetical protein